MDKVVLLYNLLCLVKPRNGDAIVWLQGDRYDRGKKVLELYRNGWSNKIILTGNNQLLSSKLRPGEKNVSLEKMSEWLKKRGISNKDIIIDSQSFNTNDQAKNVVSLAKKNSWSSLLLVGSSYHQPRAFLTFLYYTKKINWLGIIINQPFFVDWNVVPSGCSETTRNLFKKEINKIGLYKKNLSSTTTAIRYIEDKFVRIKMLPAQLKNAKFLLELRNEPTARNNSFQQEKINLIEHLGWLKKVLADRKRLLYVVYNKSDQRAIGQIRFDIKNKEAKISVSLVPECRGKGYGEEAIRYGTNYLLEKYDYIKIIVAEVKQNNAASVITFKRAGYKIQYKKQGVFNLNYTI